MASYDEWLSHLMRVVPAEAQRYATEFSKHYLPISNDTEHVLSNISEEHMREMGIAIGHRPHIRNLFTEVRRAAEMSMRRSMSVLSQRASAESRKASIVTASGGGEKGGGSSSGNEKVTPTSPHTTTANANRAQQQGNPSVHNVPTIAAVQSFNESSAAFLPPSDFTSSTPPMPQTLATATEANLTMISSMSMPTIRNTAAVNMHNTTNPHAVAGGSSANHYIVNSDRKDYSDEGDDSGANNNNNNNRLANATNNGLNGSVVLYNNNNATTSNDGSPRRALSLMARRAVAAEREKKGGAGAAKGSDGDVTGTMRRSQSTWARMLNFSQRDEADRGGNNANGTMMDEVCNFPRASEDEDNPPNQHSIIAIQRALGAIAALQEEVERNAHEDTTNYFTHGRVDRKSKNSDLTWVALFGERESEAALMSEAKGLRDEFGFPLQFIERAFKDDGPMPFFLQYENYAVLLMRIPEEGSDDGTTIKTITNRAVLLFREASNGEPPVIVTYHRIENDAFQQMHSLWVTSLKLNTTTLSTTAKEFIKRLLNLYRESVTAMETRSEAAETEPHPMTSVEKLSLIQKQASVYSRCLQSFQDVVKATDSFADFDDFADEICELAAGLNAKAMELSENANTTINLKMALDSYRSNINMKYFTYVSITCQPIALATGWYGMNWGNMPELNYEKSYFIFAGCMLGLAIVIPFSIWWFFERNKSSSESENNSTPHPIEQ